MCWLFDTAEACYKKVHAKKIRFKKRLGKLQCMSDCIVTAWSGTEWSTSERALCEVCSNPRRMLTAQTGLGSCTTKEMQHRRRDVKLRKWTHYTTVPNKSKYIILPQQYIDVTIIKYINSWIPSFSIINQNFKNWLSMQSFFITYTIIHIPLVRAGFQELLTDVKWWSNFATTISCVVIVVRMSEIRNFH